MSGRQVTCLSGLCLTLVLVGSGACTPIQPYSITLAPPEAALVPPSGGLVAYEETLAEFWTRVSTRCTAVSHAIAVEIDQRQRRQATLKRWLLGIGSAAALGATVYTGIESQPEKNVVIPLSAISGSALVSAFPALSEDARVLTLRDRLAAIEAQGRSAVEVLGALEDQLLELSLLKDESAEAAKYVEIASFETRLRGALVSWSEACR